MYQLGVLCVCVCVWCVNLHVSMYIIIMLCVSEYVCDVCNLHVCVCVCVCVFTVCMLVFKNCR